MDEDTEHRSDLHGLIISPRVNRPVLGRRSEQHTERPIRQMAACVRGISGLHRGSGSRAYPPNFAGETESVDTDWFKRRRYRHFDRPVGIDFAQEAMNPDFVAKHPFSPLIHFDKPERRYKYCSQSGKRVISIKDRPIKKSSHRDACILSYYSKMLSDRLNQFYDEAGLSDSVIAYRSLGKANYDFSSEALSFAKENSPVRILAFDVTGFFDHLDHAFLKNRLKRLLGDPKLEEHWFKVFRYMTKFRFVKISQLKAHPVFEARIREKRPIPIASISELKHENIPFHRNPTPGQGIPQGTPISAALSNLFMIDYDLAMRSYCNGVGAFYRRYSDDILVICKPDLAEDIEAEVLRLIAEENLELSPHKTEYTTFDIGRTSAPVGKAAQYLGFNFDESGAVIRQSSLSRQWRKMRRAFKRTRKIARSEILAGRADKVWTKKLRRRFTALPFGNFSSYGRRAADVFGRSEKVTRQIRRIEQAAEREFDELKKI